MVTLLYPLVIWLGQGQLEPRHMAALLVLAALLRAFTLQDRSARWWVLGAGSLALVAVVGNVVTPLKLYPVLVSLIFLGVFGYSLVVPPSVAERIARITDPALSTRAVRYTRRVTQVWCGFFVINGAIAGATALFASERVWFLYTGVVSYVLMGALFCGEYLWRMRFKRQEHDAAR
jgi:uncharacterized membrane protein